MQIILCDLKNQVVESSGIQTFSQLNSVDKCCTTEEKLSRHSFDCPAASGREETMQYSPEFQLNNV
ncbi:hypothetical protein J6590_078476 [Homalodisca vitripennis]|nr:hypothetical protein J6590_078476 [Homalodisca vitripennis]